MPFGVVPPRPDAEGTGGVPSPTPAPSAGDAVADEPKAPEAEPEVAI